MQKLFNFIIIKNFLNQACANLVASDAKFYKTQWKLNLVILIFRLKFSWNLWNIVSRRIKKLCDFWTCPRKIEIKIQPIDLLSWIKFRGPEFKQGSYLQNFSFPSLPSRSEPRDHKVSLKPHSEATRKDPDPKKNSRASFNVFDLCDKFQGHILTRSTSNRRTTRPPRDQICACLI